MKRYNIHLDPEWIEKIEKIRLAVIAEKKDSYYWTGLTRSDLIRVAIADLFGFEGTYTHVFWGDLIKIIKKVLKKRQSSKGV